ncbi:uncharacterized protein EI90DRAFT_3118213 [Cantharellus anzutake]|uniref:uncharacterized protein n=1 Tax=Cantharellus anzutake TaxID=1750568 RepID=UPI001903C934|nr:uncharacterized protein EI90DRAFT_3118213 [Cantharellus anzutake]KAF8339135.1 hypothetical protein EI90DRAFT_3118213 [Cantharellus anzutake]
MSHPPLKLKLRLNPLPSPATSVHGSSSHHTAEEMNEPSAPPPSRKKAASQCGKPKKSRKKVASRKTDVLPIITQDGLQAEGAGCAASPPGHPQLCLSAAGTCDSSTAQCLPDLTSVSDLTPIPNLIPVSNLIPISNHGSNFPKESLSNNPVVESPEALLDGSVVVPVSRSICTAPQSSSTLSNGASRCFESSLDNEVVTARVSAEFPSPHHDQSEGSHVNARVSVRVQHPALGCPGLPTYFTPFIL